MTNPAQSKNAPFGWATPYLSASPAGTMALDSGDRLDIEQTLARYAFAMDHADLTELQTVLTEDSSWTAIIAADAELGPVTGSSAIIDMIRAATSAQTDQRRHNLTNLLFRSGNRTSATVWAYLSVTSNADGSTGVVQTGFYIFTLEHGERGWRIATTLVGLDVAL